MDKAILLFVISCIAIAIELYLYSIYHTKHKRLIQIKKCEDIYNRISMLDDDDMYVDVFGDYKIRSEIASIISKKIIYLDTNDKWRLIDTGNPEWLTYELLAEMCEYYYFNVDNLPRHFIDYIYDLIYNAYLCEPYGEFSIKYKEHIEYKILCLALDMKHFALKYHDNKIKELKRGITNVKN